MTQPPDDIIQTARRSGTYSHCAKSQRGAVVFDPRTGRIVGRGWNHQPLGFSCDGSDACRAACPKLCIHAEDAAIRAVPSNLLLDGQMPGLELVHVKVVDGEVVPGGGPSCWQCSRLVVEVRLKGVWLYELDTGISYMLGSSPAGKWRFYRADEFHRLTLQHARNRLPVITLSIEDR